MTIRIGNAPGSRGVELAGDPRNPDRRQVPPDDGHAGRCTVGQGRDPTLPGSPAEDARLNRDFLGSIGF